MPANVEKLCERNDALKSERSTWDSLMQELGEVACPRKAEVVTQSTKPTADKESRIYNSTAIQCNMTLAHGQLSYAMPFSERWFATEPRHTDDDKAIKWYSKAGEIMAAGIGNSNFYTEMHEACLDRGGFGLGTVGCFESVTSPSGLIFDALSAGSYSIAENSEKLVDTVFREREFTAVQMAQEFGEDVLPEKVKKALTDDSKRNIQKYTVIHAVYPREDRDTLKLDAANMDTASCWFMPCCKTLLREGGFDGQVYFSSRYLRWGKEVYGWCPGWQALPVARQLNVLEKLMDGMAEVALYPRMLIPSTLDGVVGLGAGDVTIYNPFQNAKPEMWGTDARYDVGVDRMQRREQEIKDAYHYDLFRMFTAETKQMTAREVMERAAEKLVLFSPTFVRMQEEWLQPILDRVFRIYMRQGRFPEPPPSVFSQDDNGVHIPPPRIMFTSRVALAIRSLQSSGFMNLLETLQPMLAVDPSARHVVNVSQAAQGLGRNFGVPEEWMATEDQYQQRMQAEQQAAAEAQQAEMANQQIQTASKLKPEQIEAVGAAMGGG